ncbi:MAG: C25 family cysteine peptidase [Candidatus Diapherotrites archaeon]
MRQKGLSPFLVGILIGLAAVGATLAVVGIVKATEQGKTPPAAKPTITPTITLAPTKTPAKTPTVSPTPQKTPQKTPTPTQTPTPTPIPDEESACQTVDGANGITGLKAVEGVLFNWDFESIQYDTCEITGKNSFFCDPVQFSLSLAYRLERIKGFAESGERDKALALTEFNSLLIADNYSEDFKKDFAHYYSSRFYETPAWFAPWKQYFEDSKRLRFSPANLKPNGSGVFRVKLKLEFDKNKFEFFSSGKPAAKITVEFSKKGDFEGKKSIFHDIPFNGMVGTTRVDEDGNIERKDYGIGFKENSPVLLLQQGSQLVTSKTKSIVKEFEVILQENFNETNQFGGTIAFIDEKKGLIVFTPQNAKTVVAAVEPKNRNAYLFYWIFENNKSIGQGKKSMAWWSLVDSKKAPENIQLSQFSKPVQDLNRQLADSCKNAKAQGGTSFGFHITSIPEGKKALLKSHYFTPAKSNVFLENACPETATLFTENSQTSTSQLQLSLSDTNNSIKQFHEIIALTIKREICVINKEGQAYFQWNAETLSEQENRALKLFRIEEAKPCKESDSGNNPEQGGKTETKSENKTDNCFFGIWLKEHYCEGAKIGDKIYNCNNYCKEKYGGKAAGSCQNNAQNIGYCLCTNIPAPENQEKEAFLVSDKDWRAVLSFVPVAIRTGSDGKTSMKPLLVFHEEASGFDADSIIYFLQQYKPKKLTIIGSTPSELDRILFADSQNMVPGKSFGAGLKTEQVSRTNPKDYKKYFSSTESAVLVEDNYELALLASAYASLIGAPLLIEGFNSEQAPEGAKIICIGNPNANCSEKYSLSELQKKYLTATKTDKIILVNPQDLELHFSEKFKELKPEKSKNPVKELYGKTSLAAPILASAKQELILSVNSTDYLAIDRFIEGKIASLNPTAKYLTIIASPPAIPMGKKPNNYLSAGAMDDWFEELDRHVYADLDGDYLSDLVVGRIMGLTVSDASAYTARVLFYNEILNSKNFTNIWYPDFPFRLGTAAKMDRLLSMAGYQKQSVQVLNAGGPKKIQKEHLTNKLWIGYLDHGWFNGGHDTFTTYGLREASVWFEPAVLFVDACSTCAFEKSESSYGLFCAHAIRRGAIAYYGAVEDTCLPWDLQLMVLSEILNGKDVGSALRDSGSKGAVYPVLRYDPFFVLIGDPTLKPVFAGKSQEMYSGSSVNVQINQAKKEIEITIPPQKLDITVDFKAETALKNYFIEYKGYVGETPLGDMTSHCAGYIKSSSRASEEELSENSFEFVLEKPKDLVQFKNVELWEGSTKLPITVTASKRSAFEDEELTINNQSSEKFQINLSVPKGNNKYFYFKISRYAHSSISQEEIIKSKNLEGLKAVIQYE